ncbi:MAG: response regulator [Gemmatimonadaceae bacterium]
MQDFRHELPALNATSGYHANRAVTFSTVSPVHSPGISNGVVNDAALAVCASEPIHIPGTIQPRGVLLGLDRSCDTVLFANEAATLEFDAPVAAILGQRVSTLLGTDLQSRIRSQLAEVTDGVVVAIDTTGGAVNISKRSILAHRYDGRVIVELVEEPESEAAVSILTSNVGAIAMARRGGHARERVATPTSVAAGFHRVASTLATDPDLLRLCQSVAIEVRRLTGYDRVMVYQFDADDHGSVIAEDCKASLEPYLGLHFPASDIPAQARALYLRTRVRVLASVDDVPNPIHAFNGKAAARPLDLSHALLRSMSPIHVEYLRNMGVNATLVVSIIVDGSLWGLIACHHYTPKWPTYALRAACNVLSEFVSVQVTVQENYSRARARGGFADAQNALIRRLLVSGGRLEDVLDELRRLLPCGGVAVVMEDRVHSSGITPPDARIRDLVRWFGERESGQLMTHENLALANPDFADIAGVASGVLALDMGGIRPSFVMWFRPATVSTVRWAGSPGTSYVDATGVPRLSPRSSFAEWKEERKDFSEPWSVEEVAVAEIVRGALVEVVLELLATRHKIERLDLVRIRSAVEGASDPIAVADADGNTIYANPAFVALAGGDSGVLLDLQNAFGLALSDDHDRILSETTLSLPDGSQIPVELRVDQILDDTGTRIGTLFMATDVRPRRALESERQRIEQKLAQTQKLESLGVLAGGIAHDFNNLLTTIVANASLAQEELPAGSVILENVNAISRAAEHAAALCRGLLAYAGRGQFELEQVNTNLLLTDLGNLLRSAIGNNCSTVYNLAEKLPLISADTSQLRQVLMNLIVNASDAIGEARGTITISTSAEDRGRAYLDSFRGGNTLAPGRYVEIRVADDGCGMSDETCASIFDPFFTTKFMGRGLGLAAVLGIVRAHNGALRVESTLGVGTQFIVLLPALTESRAGVLGGPSAARIAGDGRTVLLVDDDVTVRDATRRILARAGFNVVLANDGQDALEILDTGANDVSIIVSDIMMPRLTGVQMHSKLRERGATTPLLLISGYSEHDSKVLATLDSYTTFVEKPFGMDRLLGEVAGLLR